MSGAPNSAFPYRVSGGSLEVENPTYVVRSADREFYEQLKAGEFCYVLNSRQMGKSSLRVRTMHQLQKQGIACADIDLTGIVSKQTTVEQWYMDIIKEMVSCFALKVNRRTWWREHNDLTPVHRFNVFIEEVLLAQVSENIVIFVDEIDSVLGLSFPIDDFFALIRACYDKRPGNPEYRRLTWALLGVATPSDLMQDKERTPFNIGQAIELKGFQIDECVVLEKGFAGKFSNPWIVLQEVLKWTGGQPFLTQKLCGIVATCEVPVPTGGEAQWVEQLVRSRIIKNWEAQDEPPHLKTIRDRMLSNPERSGRLLRLYQKILQPPFALPYQRRVVAKKRTEHMELRLSGLVVQQEGNLRVYNPIYKSVFNLDWVTKELKALQSSPRALSAQTVLLMSVIVTVLVMGVRSLSLLQSWELNAFDQMLQLRPSEKPDPRLLIVKVTGEDTKKLGGEYPISDRTLLRLLQKLEEHQPQVIGVDIYRNEPEREGHADLIKYLQKSEAQGASSTSQVIPVCMIPSTKLPEGIAPPPGISALRTGFGDVVLDRSDGIVRRHLLATEPPDKSPCTANYALSSQLARRYLEPKGYILTFPTPDSWKLGSVRFELLKAHTGFYQQEKITNGHQILLNYHSDNSLENIAQQVTLTQVLTNQVKPNLISGRIILIGVTDPSLAKDDFRTPYKQEIRGLLLHAQMVSQLISAVENQRPLLSFWPLWGDALWVWAWSLVGGLLVWRFQSLLHQRLTVGAVLIFLFGICFIFFLNQSLLLPLIPSVLALVTTSGTITVMTTFQTQRQQ